MNDSPSSADADIPAAPAATTSGSLRQRLLRYFDDRVPDILAAQNADGSFGPLRMINDQYAFYPLALLYTTQGSKHYRSPEVLAAALRGMVYLERSIDEQGRVDFIGQAGFSHGWVLHDWSAFYWQEALMLLRGEADSAWWAHHTQRLRQTVGFHFIDAQQRWRQFGGRFDQDVHNLFVWKALLVYRAGVLWAQQAWRDLGEQILQAAVAGQREEGWWSEGGPTGTYSLVTAQAISLYHEWSGDPAALRAIGKALAYHAALTYPNGTFIETIDGRVRYHDTVSMILPPGFSRFPQGQEYLGRLFDRLPKTLEKLQGISMMGSCLAYLRDAPTEPGPEPLNAERQIFPNLHTAVLRRHGFCICLSGYESVPQAGGFRLDRQNLLSVWHERAGLIVGGGHSKLQPAFSCFNAIDRRGQVHYLHHQPTIQLEGDLLRLDLRYGDVPVWLEVRTMEADRLRIAFGCDALDAELEKNWHVQAQLILRGVVGEPLHGEACEQVLDERSVWWAEEDHGRRLSHNGWTLSLPADSNANVQWPVRPFNSYRRDRKSPLDAAAILVGMPLTSACPCVACEVRVI